MTKELSNNLYCILLKNNIEIWLEKERADSLMETIKKSPKGTFIKVEGQDCEFQKEEVSGCFSAKSIEERSRRKNGEWRDRFNNWHQKGERVCGCGNVIPEGKVCGYCG